jgi:iron complex transport system ATP-binding protein
MLTVRRQRVKHANARLMVPLLDLVNVTVRLGAHTALDRVSLRIGQQEHVAVLGANGSGKTTLLRLLLREVYPVQSADASMRVLGRELWNVAEMRASFGIVNQELVQQCRRHRLGVLETVVSGFFSSVGIWPNHLVTDEMREEATAALARVGASALVGRRVHELSSGEARRVLIARALVHHPRTLVLDEPTNSLDPVAMRELRAHLTTLMDEGVHLILVTHHLHELLPGMDRLVLMRQGRVAHDGPRAGLLREDVLSDVFGGEMRLVERDGVVYAV